MPSATRIEIYPVTPQAFYETIVDYEAYPEFVDHVQHVEVLKKTRTRARARFTLHYIREVQYTLDLHHEQPVRVWWEFVEGDVFRKMDGSWTLTPRGKTKTEVEYTVDVEARVTAPGFIVRQLVAHSLPKMMNSFYERTRENLGR